MAYPLAHKTVMLMDRSAVMERSCGIQFEMDSLNKARGAGFIPLASISKSVWTCAVEAMVEYCRVVWDIFPGTRLIKAIINGGSVVPVNSWSQEDQHLSNLMSQLAAVMHTTAPTAGGTHTLYSGLGAALQALGEATEAQKTAAQAESGSKVMNRGRVVVLTQLADDFQVKRIQEWFLDALLQHNRVADNSDQHQTIHSCDLVLVSVYPASVDVTVAARPSTSLSSILTSSVVPCKAGPSLASTTINLVLSHYDLASTTVTGIPMKEEQNSGSSANYDVELLHPTKVYEAILKGCPIELAHLRTSREGADYETVTLKWCTPRTGNVELHQCTSASRATPVDVNSRPSSCLTNFLLNGRAVMLEMSRKTGGKFVSHMLAAHGGEIFMHALGSGRSVLEDPPSISEGAGGRVTDYRIPEFGQLIRENHLVPVKPTSSDAAVPLHHALEQLNRYTRFWPLTLSESYIFPLPNMDIFNGYLVKEEMTEEDVLDCKKIIYNLVSMESRHEPLQSVLMGNKGRGIKREEQYRAMWSELETLVRAHNRSSSHQAVLECVLECRNRPDQQGVKPAEERVGLDQAMEELDRCTAPVLDSPLSPPPPTKKWRPNKSGQPQSLLALWTSRVDADHALKRLEFSGRLNGDSAPAKLYAHLDKAENKEDVKKKT